MELVQVFAPLGIGGILAGVIFYFHIQQDKQWRDQNGQWRERYEAIAGEFRIIVQENTKAIQSNTDCIREFIGAAKGTVRED